MFFYIEPEVAGGIGPSSETHREHGRLVVTRLNYEFDGWLGDSVLETTPCFIATDDARKLIEAAELTGIRFGDVEISRSGTFIDLYGDRSLPIFWWMIVEGVPKIDDIGVSDDLRLVVSEKALKTLKAAGIDHAEVQPVAMI